MSMFCHVYVWAFVRAVAREREKLVGERDVHCDHNSGTQVYARIHKHKNVCNSFLSIGLELVLVVRTNKI